MSREEVIAIFKVAQELVDYLLPFFAVFVLLGAIIPIGLLCASWVLERAENAAAGLALAMDDTRKKKRDEYDAYYDERLSDPRLRESATEDDVIAYYEDDAISHLTNK